ncbi:MAG TPA: PadR family transcriptional regulator [Chitinophagaceae bacterium]|nr:PadR family transcriptional regulator [Chitinophagaceae bacterium]
MSGINTDNIQSQMKKGLLEFAILSIIMRGEAYPSDIAGELKESGMQVLEGTLYPLLTRLKNAGYLDYRWVESTGGPPRKYFQLTENGKEFYKSLQSTWTELSQAVNKITQIQSPQ